MSDDSVRPPKPLLLIGYELPAKGIDSCRWEDVSRSGVNPNDYTGVLVDASGPETSTRNVAVSDLKARFTRFFSRPDAILVVVGRLGRHALGLSALGWPQEYPVQHELGSALGAINPEYKEYFQQFVPQWSGFVREELWVDGGRERGLLVNSSPLAVTTFGAPLAANYQLVVDLVGGLGQVTWLPEPIVERRLEALLWIVRNVFELSIDRPSPVWAEAFQLPGEQQVRHELRTAREELARRQQHIESTERALTTLVRARRLLYEQHDALQQIVWEVLREIGAEVIEPKVKNREDGVLVDPLGRRAVMEIKGLTGGLKRRDIRELDDWKEAVDGEAGQDVPASKGLLIVNLYCDKPPAERVAPLPPDCRDALGQFRFALLPTSQLFQALVAAREGTLDRDVFWETLFSTIGATSLPEPHI
jgi:hypothetical protein